MNGSELRHELARCVGSEELYHHSLVKSFNYTEGVRSFFQNAGGGAYWLSDILATEPAIKRGVREHGLCVVVLSVTGAEATLTVARDLSESEDNPPVLVFDAVIYERQIAYTDCPEGNWKFYITPQDTGTGLLVLLPSEY